MHAFKNHLAPPAKHADLISPADAAFAYEDQFGRLSQQRQPHRDSVINRREIAVDSGYSSDKASLAGLPSPREEKTVAQMHEETIQRRRDRLMPTLKQRIKNESPVVAHLRTNVIVSAVHLSAVDRRVA